MVLVSNNSGREARALAAAFPGRVGHLYTPAGFRGPWPEFPYAAECGIFPDAVAGREWNLDPFRRLLDRMAAAEARTGIAPMWVAVPDQPFDASATLARWAEWAPRCRAYGWPLAFVAQNGHTPADVPAEAAVVFIGGDQPWKWAHAGVFARAGYRVHVGRVNTARRFVHFRAAGAESGDGTGMFRGDRRQLDRIWYFLADSAGRTDCGRNGPMQPRLFGGEWAA